MKMKMMKNEKSWNLTQDPEKIDSKVGHIMRSSSWYEERSNSAILKVPAQINEET